MLPTGGMGANQAIESSVALVNELQKVLRDSQDGTFPRDALSSALARYYVQRRPRAGRNVEFSGLLCRAQMGHGGPAGVIRRDAQSASVGDLLFRGFTSYSEAPVIDGIEPSLRGQYFDQAIEEFRQKVKARSEGQLPVTNSQLFGLAAGEETARNRIARLKPSRL
jgi:hypothetical protein